MRKLIRRLKNSRWTIEDFEKYMDELNASNGALKAPPEHIKEEIKTLVLMLESINFRLDEITNQLIEQATKENTHHKRRRRLDAHKIKLQLQRYFCIRID